ncbi:MAG: OmpA family protein [Sphingobacteriia bacterium]|nr:OmpA family protein [Sphingobacteriia bacterium]
MKKLTAVVLPALAISACVNLSKVEHGKVNTYGPEYKAQLAKNYSEMAKEQANELDWIDAENFASKAVKASQNKNVMPEDPNNWSLKGEFRAEFQEYRDLVDMLMTEENKRLYPKQLANLVSSFDSLLEQQAEDAHHIEKLLDKRDTFIRNVRFFLGETAFLPHQKVVKSEMVFFNNNSHNLGKLGKKVIQRAVKKLAKQGMTKFSRVVISSHSDKVGTDGSNYHLALERAAAVKNHLVALGVDERNIEIVNYGESKPMVKTGKSHVKNRRVEIDFVN